MVQARVSDVNINFALVYTVDHIFLVLPINDLINKYRKRTTSFKLSTGTKPLVSHIHVLFLSICCTKSYCTRRQKCVKCASPSAKGFSWYLCWNSAASKRVYCVCTEYKEYNFFICCCFWWKFCYYVSIYVTTSCRSDGYDWVYDIYTLCYIFRLKNWRYNHVLIVWRGKFIIWNSWQCGK